jgi:hypothetical protein
MTCEFVVHGKPVEVADCERGIYQLYMSNKCVGYYKVDVPGFIEQINQKSNEQAVESLQDLGEMIDNQIKNGPPQPEGAPLVRHLSSLSVPPLSETETELQNTADLVTLLLETLK